MIETRFLKKQHIDSATRERIIAVLKEGLSKNNAVVFAYLHGSCAEGDSFRDIDVAAFVSGHCREIEFESDLSYELTEKTSYPVDVKVINKAPVAFQMAVLRKGIVLVSRSELVRTDFIEDVSKRYIEYTRFRDILLDA